MINGYQQGFDSWLRQDTPTTDISRSASGLARGTRDVAPELRSPASRQTETMKRAGRLRDRVLEEADSRDARNRHKDAIESILEGVLGEDEGLRSTHSVSNPA